VPPSSEGHSYRGPLRDGYWVDAADLTAGYRLLNADATWAEVEVVEEPLEAYNLTVADFHTYFVAGQDLLRHRNPRDYIMQTQKTGLRPTNERYCLHMISNIRPQFGLRSVQGRGFRL